MHRALSNTCMCAKGAYARVSMCSYVTYSEAQVSILSTASVSASLEMHFVQLSKIPATQNEARIRRIALTRSYLYTYLSFYNLSISNVHKYIYIYIHTHMYIVCCCLCLAASTAVERSSWTKCMDFHKHACTLTGLRIRVTLMSRSPPPSQANPRRYTYVCSNAFQYIYIQRCVHGLTTP
jgi:hypothetical protein